MRNDSLFNKCCRENWISACRKLKLDPCLNIRPKTLKLVQERVGNTLDLRGIANNFLNRTPIAQ
jgi:hypothetical protein